MILKLNKPHHNQTKHIIFNKADTKWKNQHTCIKKKNHQTYPETCHNTCKTQTKSSNDLTNTNKLRKTHTHNKAFQQQTKSKKSETQSAKMKHTSLNQPKQTQHKQQSEYMNRLSHYNKTNQ